MLSLIAVLRFPGNTACYLAALQNKESSILAFGPEPSATEKLLSKSETLNASNVHIVNEPFLQSSSKDKIFKGVRGILCNPPSTLSGVVDIIGEKRSFSALGENCSLLVLIPGVNGMDK